MNMVQTMTEKASKYGIYIAFIILCIIMSFLSPYFLTFQNIVNILNQVSIIGIIAIGSTMVLLSGGLDLSPGSIVAFSGVMAAHFAHPGEYPIIVPILVGIGSGAALGLINGFVTAKGKVPPFIVTLGMMSIGRGLAMLACDGMQVINLSEPFKMLGGSKIFGIPVLIVFYAGIFLLAYFTLEKTRFGRHMYAVGGNETAAHVSGLNVDRIKILVYTIAAGLSGLGGLLLASRTVVGSPIAGMGYELDAIAAAVIGGTSTTGGVGRVTGTIIGALIIQVISNGLDMVNVPSYYQQIVKGTIIIFAVFVDMKTKQRA
ncbi:MAG: ABC transporter permease [Spirochaetales bacterium]|nr:ABC transporter permease [Spirochaetales bacterium]MCF7939610.1 ABC transporter permease [Spirochaetales bacterium]